MGSELPVTLTADPQGMGIRLTPDPSVSIEKLIIRAHNEHELIQNSLDLWRPPATSGTSQPTALDMITGFNNTYCDIKLEFFHRVMRRASRRNADLYTEAIETFHLSAEQYTATARMDRYYGIQVYSCLEVSTRRKYGPQYPQLTEALVTNGTGAYRIQRVQGPHRNHVSGFEIVEDSSCPRPCEGEVVVTTEVAGYLFELGIFKNNKLIKVIPFDSVGNTIRFSLPWQFLCKGYTYFEYKEELEEIGSILVGPGQIVWIKNTAHGRATLQVTSNRGLLAIPSAAELEIIEQGEEKDPDF